MAGLTSLEAPYQGKRPPSRALLASAAIHLAVLALLIVAVRVEQAREKLLVQTAQARAGERMAKADADVVYVAPTATTPSHLTYGAPKRVRRHPEHVQGVPGGTGTSPVEQLRADAHVETKALTNFLRIRGIYGWAPGPDYKLAVQTAGEWPKIAAEELPSRYEQYVQIEVTIDLSGSVADARIVSGIVDEKIQQKLLAAVREFKYVPATRNGSPIPSQRDIVIHVPS
jgi:TonB family protein